MGCKTFHTKALCEPPPLWKNLQYEYILYRSHMDVLWLFTLEKTESFEWHYIIPYMVRHCATVVFSFQAIEPCFKLHCLHFSSLYTQYSRYIYLLKLTVSSASYFYVALYWCAKELQTYLSTSKWSAGGQHGDVLHMRKAFQEHTVPQITFNQ